ncbi:MAG: putative lipid II flippase FtsW [Patescibacteria group bacterium]
MGNRLSRTNPDYFFIALTGILVIFGLVMLSSASSDLAKNKFGDSYYYLKHQILYGFSFGLAGFIFSIFVHYRWLQKLAPYFLVFNILLLLLVFIPSLGIKVLGGERWLNIGFFSFQPSELLKLSFFIYLAAWVSKTETRSKSFLEGFLPFFVLIAVVMVILLMEPATTTAILIFGASLIMYFSAGARIKFLALSLLLVVLSISTLIYYTPYRLERVLSFLHPETDQLGSSYHINQAFIAIGSGGLTGVGFGKSTTKLKYLPEPIGDSIFAVIAEELGFIGAISLVIVFFLYVFRGLMIARASPDNFSKNLVTGFACIVGLQAFINIAAISGIIPLSGVPLPFISYGGTALAVFMTMSGIILNISRYRR